MVYWSHLLIRRSRTTMRQLIDALLVAGLGYLLLASSTHAATLMSASDTTAAYGQPYPSGYQGVQGDVTAVRATPQARIIKPFGAAFRAAPSSDSAVLASLACGAVLRVIGFEDGWVQVLYDDKPGWVGGGRVAVGTPPAPADCDGGYPFWVGQYVGTFVETGCLSLRAAPSRDAQMLACVGSGHEYEIVDGPFDPGTGEDWYAVYSRSTGSGWVLARYLIPG